MKLAVIGSRSFRNTKKGFKILDSIHRRLCVTVVVSGGAPEGGDRVAELWAEARKIPVELHKAEWDKYGKAAGFIRNVLIIKASDRVLAFWDGQSKGTKHSLDLARKHKKLRRIVYFKSKPIDPSETRNVHSSARKNKRGRSRPRIGLFG